MIDARRWVLAEAWLSLGLRIEWVHRFERLPDDAWQEDEEERGRYYYEGYGVWRVLDNGPPVLPGFTKPVSPQMGTETLKHELAHYLVSSEEERGKRNFGLDRNSDDAEERALAAERVIDSLLVACGRIAGSALAGGRL